MLTAEERHGEADVVLEPALEETAMGAGPFDEDLGQGSNDLGAAASSSKKDTLYDHEGRHYFEDSYIDGSIDFIFCIGLSLYEALWLMKGGMCANDSPRAVTSTPSRKRHSDPWQRRKEHPSRKTQDSPFLTVRLQAPGCCTLGCAWGSYACVVYSYTYMDNSVIPVSWSNWNYAQRNQTVVFGQYKRYGPGAKRTGRVPWSHELPDVEARPFLSLSFIDGDEWVKPGPSSPRNQDTLLLQTPKTKSIMST